jgi:hypothetical protein
LRRSPRTSRCCSWPTTCTRAIRPRCAGWPISREGSTAFRSQRWRHPGPPSRRSGCGSTTLAIPGVGVRLPQPLRLSATCELIARRLAGPQEFARACQVATGGNPWLLRELLEAARTRARPTAESAALVAGLAGGRVRPAVLARIGRLDPASAQLARAVAVLGDGCELRHAQGLARIGSAAALAALPALVTAGVLADDQPLAFAHPLLRTAVYLDMPAPVRAAEHQRAAALLHAANADPEAVAHHLLAAEPAGEEWALEVLGESAKTAMARGAPESAVAYLRRALLDPGPAARFACGAALARQRDAAAGRQGALEVLEEALELARKARHYVPRSSPPAWIRWSHRAGPPTRGMLVAVLAGGEGSTRSSSCCSSASSASFAPWMERASLGGRPAAIGDGRGMRRRPRGVTQPAPSPSQVLCDGTADAAVALARRALAGCGARRCRRALRATAARRPRRARPGGRAAGGAARSRAGARRSPPAGSIMGQGIGLGWRALIQCLAGSVTEAENDGRASLRDPVGNGSPPGRARGRLRGCVGIDRAWRAG